MRLSLFLLFVLLASTASAGVARAAAIGGQVAAENGVGRDCSHPSSLRFARGQHAVVVRGIVTRDQVGCYAFVARVGQVLDVAMGGASTGNAAVVVFEPGWSEKTVESLHYIDGRTLPGAGRSDVARHVNAKLPVGGRYLIMTAPAYGGAAGYTVRVQIR